MKNNKNSYKNTTSFRLVITVAIILFVISLLCVGIYAIHQSKVQKSKEPAILTAVDGCLTACENIFIEMDLTNDETILAHKKKIADSKSSIDKYYATIALMDYTDELYRNYRDKAASEYYKLDPNNYEADLYQQELNNLQKDFLNAQVELEKAKEEYSVLK